MADYYVSNNGNDASDGRSVNTPWATLAKVTSSVFAPGDTIRFQRGGVWIGQLNASGSGTADAPIVYGAYGYGDNPVILSSLAVSAGAWTKTGGLTNVYQATVTGGHIDQVWASSEFSVWDASFQWAAKVASAAACDVSPGRCFYDTTTDTLYLHTWDSSNPAVDGDTYSVTVYESGVSSEGWDYLQFEDLSSLFVASHGFFTAGVNNGLPWRVSTGVTFRRCYQYGAVHNGFSLLGVDIAAEDCEVRYYRNDGAFVLADARVADPSNPATNGLTLTRCTAGLNPAFGGLGAYAFKPEGTPSNVMLTDCDITGDCTIGVFTNGGETVSGFTITNLAISGAVGVGVSDDDSFDLVIDGLTMTSPASAYGVAVNTNSGFVLRNSTVAGALAAVSMGATADAMVYRNTLDGGAIYGVLMTAGGSHEIVNNVIVGTGYGVVWTDATLITSDVIKNNIFVGHASVMVYNSATAIDEDYNIGHDVTWWANDALTLTAYRAATSLGAASNVVNPWFVNEGAGDYHLKGGSPAVDAGAVVPPITDGFTGPAPDIGRYEADGPLAVAYSLWLP